MFGVNFLDGYNSLICVGAEFVVRGFDGSDTVYKWDSGPNNEHLQERNQYTREWESVDKTIEQVLPQSFGLKWKRSDFILALSFWCQGRRK